MDETHYGVHCASLAALTMLLRRNVLRLCTSTTVPTLMFVGLNVCRTAR